MGNRLSVGSMALALAALGYAGWLHWTLRREAEEAAQAAIASRERILALKLFPSLAALWKDSGFPDPLRKPDNLEDVMDLFGRIVDNLSGKTSSGARKK